MKKRIGLRAVVASLVLAIVAPLGVLATFGLYRSWGRALAYVDRQNVATVRAVSTAVDQEIESTTRALSVLVALHAFDDPDLPAFESLASRLIQSQSNFSALLLTRPDGTVIDGVPDAADASESVGNMGWAQATAAVQRTTVSSMFELPGETGRFLMIGVPVVRQRRVTQVLGARIKTDGLSELLRRQQAPLNGAVALLDSSYRIIARTREEDQFVGAAATPAFIEQLSRATEGTWSTVGRDGIPNYSAYSKSSRTGLTVGLGLPQAEIDGPLRRILWGLLGAWVAVLAVGAAVGVLLGGVIVRTLGSASRASMALARGEAIAPPSSRIVEIDDLSTGLRQAAATVQARNRERDEASRLKDEFLMTVSHELRTPLTAILGWARMLSTGEIRDGQKARALEAIERNANALHQLVNDLLDVSRIVSGKLRLDVQPVALSETISAAIDTIRPAADAKKIEIVTSIDLGGRWVHADPSRLQQVIWNLLSNAVKFTPQGGRIAVTVSRVGDAVEIGVTDSGSGVEPEFLPFVFDRFRQGVTGTTRSHGGLGLGLAIVRHLTELHGGTVRAENNSSSTGATFRVRLPAAAPVRPDAAIPAEVALVAAPRVRLDDLDVLVVDDDLHARELFMAILENAGARVKAAASAEDALVILDGWSPDALLSDIEMPEVDGYSLMEKVRARKQGVPLVAIAITAHVSAEDRIHAINAGYQYHLAKPIEPAELISVVATLTARHVA